MHIVHIGKYYAPAVGGMESLVRSHARTQAAMGHRVDVIVVNHLNRKGNNLIGKKLGFAKNEATMDGPVCVHRTSRVGSIFKCDISSDFSNTIKSIAKTRPDVWHLHTPNATAVVAMQRLLRYCSPLVITHHSDVFHQWALRPFYESLEARLYRHAKALISDTQGYVAGSRQLGKFPTKISVIPIGVDIKTFSRSTADVDSLVMQYTQEFKSPIWLCVGRMVPYKGFQVAIEALRHVAGTLLFVGDGPLSDHLKEMAKSLNLSDRVYFLGHCSFEQLRALYRVATALWFPSTERNEGFGIAQVEAMASGCPVINTEIVGSGVHEVSIHDKTGFTVPCHSPHALAAAAQRLLDNENLRIELADNAKKWALEFDNDRVNAKLIDLYQSVQSQT